MVRECKVRDGSLRIWLDEFPAAIISSGIPTESKFRAKPALLRFRRLACEMAKLTGKSNYALLGCEVGEPRELQNNVRILETDEHGAAYADSLLRKSETVRIGLPAEFIPGVLKGLAFAEPLVSGFQLCGPRRSWFQSNHVFGSRECACEDS
jgi:hypothetical protein